MNEHSLRVAEKVPEKYRLVALLHDLVEDYPISLEQTVELFRLSDWEAEALKALTRSSGVVYTDYIQSIIELEGKPGKCAQTIKMADLEDSLNRCTDSLKKRYTRALRQMMYSVSTKE